MDARLELVVVPVTDIDRAKAFYAEQVGFAVDVDHRTEHFRVVQLTPVGSACSVTLMHNEAAAGTLQGLHLVVTDIAAALAELRTAGVAAGDVVHFGPAGQQPGPDPEGRDDNSFVHFADPDGNGWVLQEVASRR